MNQSDLPRCEEYQTHETTVKRTKATLPNESQMETVASFFKVLGDQTRLKIITALLQEELCVCDICALLSLTQSNASHQLRILKSARLVKYRRKGKQVFYQLEDQHIHDILTLTLEHLTEKER